MKVLCFALGLFLLCGVSFADVYFLYNESTGEAIDISPRDDAVVEVGRKKIVLEGVVSDYSLEQPLRYYNYKDGRFVLNVQKMTDEAAVEAKQKARSEELLSIDKKMQLLAKKELEKEGVVFKEIKDEDFE